MARQAMSPVRSVRTPVRTTSLERGLEAYAVAWTLDSSRAHTRDGMTMACVLLEITREPGSRRMGIMCQFLLSHPHHKSL